LFFPWGKIFFMPTSPSFEHLKFIFSSFHGGELMGGVYPLFKMHFFIFYPHLHGEVPYFAPLI
jgi:hypothetical protein